MSALQNLKESKIKSVFLIKQCVHYNNLRKSTATLGALIQKLYKFVFYDSVKITVTTSRTELLLLILLPVLAILQNRPTS